MIEKVPRQYLEYVVEPQARQFCGPIFFASSLKVAVGNISASGSFGLIDTGKKRILVTCFHVWKEFQNQKLQTPELNLCLCLDARNPIVCPPTAPLAQHRELDIVTFDMESLLPACAGRKFFPLHESPPRRLAKDDVLYIIGFPGYLRIESNDDVGFGRQPYGIKVSSVDGLRFHSDVSNLKIKPDHYGGISGSPCYLVKNDKPIRLVGFATSLLFNDTLGFVHARCLKPDGTINGNA